MAELDGGGWVSKNPKDAIELIKGLVAMIPAPTKTKSTPVKRASTEGPGIIASILEFVKAGPISKDDILSKLVKRFPDRESKAMKSTIGIQLGGRLAKEKKVVIQKDDNGLYSIA